MRRFCLAVAVSLSVSAGAVPAPVASAATVVGAGTFDLGYFDGGTQLNLNASVSAGTVLGLGVYSFPGYLGTSAVAGVAQVTCLRVEGNKASMILRSLTNTGPAFGTQVLFVEDRGLLGLLGARDRVAGQALHPPLPLLSACPPVNPPAGFQHELATGDFSILGLP